MREQLESLNLFSTRYTDQCCRVEPQVYPNDLVGVSDFTIFRGFIQSRAAGQRC
jgi:hypothetical protein